MTKKKGDIEINNVFTCSDFGYLDTSSDSVTEDEILEYLAGIIVDIYLADESAKKNLDTEKIDSEN